MAFSYQDESAAILIALEICEIARSERALAGTNCGKNQKLHFLLRICKYLYYSGDETGKTGTCAVIEQRSRAKNLAQLVVVRLQVSLKLREVRESEQDTFQGWQVGAPASSLPLARKYQENQFC